MTAILHPKCGKRFPKGERTGHCGNCCETFIGLGAFDEHRVGDHGTDRRCEIQPYETTGDDGKVRYGHWQDERGYWHHGKRLTAAEKDAIWGERSAAKRSILDFAGILGPLPDGFDVVEWQRAMRDE